MPRKPAKRSSKRGLKNKKFRSGSEVTVAEYLLMLGVVIKYETERIEYPVVATRKYTPDFLLPNGVYLEVKGWFKAHDRAKHLRIKEAHPHLDIRFVFDNPNKKLTKAPNGKTYAQWCEKHGFMYCKLSDGIPEEWMQ